MSASSFTNSIISKYKSPLDPVTQPTDVPAVASEPTVNQDTAPATKTRGFSFDDIWSHVLKSEGSYSNHPDDPGGETMYGISQRAFPDENIKGVTPERARDLFKQGYYDAVDGDTLMQLNPGLTAHVTDMAFNAGPKTAVRLLYDALGMKRQYDISPELIERLGNSDNLEDIIKNYSVARLKYYASLRNAPTFIKGWTNRVNNLNKKLKLKAGLDGAYRSARDLDLATLVQHQSPATQQLSYRFKDFEKEDEEQELNTLNPTVPGYTPISLPDDGELSTIGEVYGASYKAKYYLDTVKGLNELTVLSAREASKANREALGDKFEEGMLEKFTGGLYGGVYSLKDFEEEVKAFKEAHPDIKLPYETPDKVHELAQQRAQKIQADYDSLDSGNFKDGLGASLDKLSHVVFGYLPGMIMGSMSDPTEAAVNLAPLPALTSAKNIAKGVAAVMGGTAVLQPSIQSKRGDLGLESGFEEAATNVASAGVGQAVLGTLSKAVGSMWKMGAKKSAETTIEAAEKLKEALKETIPDAQTEHLKRVADTVVEQANDLKNNPIGDDKFSKELFEKRIAEASEDLLQGKPVREFNDLPNRYKDTTKETLDTFTKINPDPEAQKVFADNLKIWDDFKRKNLQTDPKFEVTVPVLGPGDLPYRFDTKAELEAFINSPRGKSLGDVLTKEQAPDGTWYVGRSTDLEAVDPSAYRMLEKNDEQVGNFIGEKGSTDIEILKKYPDLVKRNDLSDLKADKNPVYKERTIPKEHIEYFERFKDNWDKQMDDLYKRSDVLLTQAKDVDPDLNIDIGDIEPIQAKLGDFLADVQEERVGLKEMFTCMVGGPAN